MTGFQPSTCVVVMGNWRLCFQWQLVSMTSLAANRAKLQATILSLLETRKVVSDNTVIVNPKLLHQSSVAPFSSDNRSKFKSFIINKKHVIVTFLKKPCESYRFDFGCANFLKQTLGLENANSGLITK